MRADESYIRESVLYPQAKIVAGYDDIMPTFKGLITEDGLLKLVEYVKSLGPKNGTQTSATAGGDADQRFGAEDPARRTRTSPQAGSVPKESVSCKGNMYDYGASSSRRNKRITSTRQNGLKSWLLTQDHKRIAILYLIAVTFFFALGGMFAVLIRLELATPAGDLLESNTYNKVFTMHGIIMVFFFLIPSIPAILGNFLIPLMIGAKDLAFPADQSAELVHLHARRRVSLSCAVHRRRRYRLDLLHAFQHVPIRTAT